jgi:hypothetical protein
VKCEPEVGNGIIPGTRDRAERRQEKVVEDADKETGATRASKRWFENQETDNLNRDGHDGSKGSVLEWPGVAAGGYLAERVVMTDRRGR